jgi:2'-5' RNA ligase
VLWAGVDGDLATLRLLQRRLDEKLSHLGYPPEDREFSPHLTLARVPEDQQRDVADALAEALASTGAPSVPIPVRDLALMRSELRPGGPVYTRLFAAPLA